MSAEQIEQVSRLLMALADGPVALADQSLAPAELGALGLLVEDPWVRLPAQVELLEAEAIQKGLSATAKEWLSDIRLFPAIGSTNTWMMESLAQNAFDQAGLDGVAALAECQLAGRGRRGRAWRSPLGSNVALSMGFSLARPVSELGGVSLVVGMAAVDALDPDGSVGLSLKWPNDLLLNGGKLAGILVEVAQREGVCEVCVGIGVNWRISNEVRTLIDRATAEVGDFAPGLGRNQGAALLISRIAEFVRAFAETGFEPMREEYDKIHAYQGQNCRIEGDRSVIEGSVLGVSAGGELRLQTAQGVQHFSSGEVSLRRQ